MRKQQKIWSKEHIKNASIPKLASTTAASSVIYFLNYVASTTIHPPRKIVDIGCGKGRNTIYLAQKGLIVFAMDYIEHAITYTKQLAKNCGVEHAVTLLVQAIDRRWPFTDNFFDLAIDNYSSIDIETKKGRDTYKNELLRTLKPGGRALVCVVSADDGLEQEMQKTNPGKEIHSTIWPSGKFQKNYDEKELRTFYKEFEIMKLEKISQPAFKLGKKYVATDYRMILRKPA